MNRIAMMVSVITANANSTLTEGNGTIDILPFILILFGICISIVALQIFLSKRKNKVAGLIIPIMLPTTLVGFFLFSVWGIVLSLILCGIVLVIFSFYISKRKKKSELDEMSVQIL
jgi:hypothetical protein